MFQACSISMTLSLNNKRIPPKSLFLIDAIGALLTTVCIAFVLKPFEMYIGLPANILNVLAVIAGVFSTYSFCCFFFLRSGWRMFLFSIGAANILYCIFTTILLIIHAETISMIGLSYFLAEMGIITWLAITEFKTGIYYNTN